MRLRYAIPFPVVAWDWGSNHAMADITLMTWFTAPNTTTIDIIPRIVVAFILQFNIR